MEEVLRREAERVGYSETCINKVVYDSVEDPKLPKDEEDKNVEDTRGESIPDLPTT